MPVSFKELLDTYELFGMAAPAGSCEIVLCKETGEIYCRSDLEELATPDEELPADIDNEEKYITLPDRRGSIWALNWLSTSRANSCPMISMKSGTSSAGEAPIRTSRPCLTAEGFARNGMISKRRPSSRRCAPGVRTI